MAGSAASAMRRVRGRFVAIAVIAAALVLSAWALASPPGSSPDDIYHSVSIWCAGGERAGVCEIQPDGSALVPAPVTFGICHTQDPTRSAACYREGIAGTPGLSNQPAGRYQPAGWGQFYPPIYYRVMHVLVTDDAEASLLAMRLVNAAIAIGFGATALLLAMRARRGGAALSWLVSAVPMGLFLVASLNPHAWGLIGAASAWLLALSWREQPTAGLRAVTALACLSAIGLASSGRFDAGLYAAIGAALALLLSPAFQRWLQRNARALVIAGVGAALAIAVLTTASRQGGFLTLASRGPDGIDYDRLYRNLEDVPQLWFGNFGSFGGIWGLGQMDTLVPAAAGVLGIIAFGAALFLGISQIWAAKAAVIAVIVGLLVAIPAYMFQLGLVDGAVDVGNGIQPRYLLPLLIILAGLALVTRTAAGGLSMPPGQRWMLWALVTVAHAFALHAILRRYVTGQDVRALNLDLGIEWWWTYGPSPMMVWLVGSAAFGLLAYLVVAQFVARAPEVPPTATTDPSR